VTLPAREALVLADEREGRPGRMIEGGRLEAGFGVALPAVFLHALAVHVRVARRAAIEGERHLDTRLVATRAGHLDVGTREHEPCPAVFERASGQGGPPIGDVTRDACRPERAPMGRLVARRAAVEAHAAEHAGRVALLTRGRPVRPGERELRAPVVVLTARLLEGDRRRVARGARSAERALVRVQVTESARRLRGEVAALLVAGGAFRRHLGVLALQRVAGFDRVREGARVEPPQVGLHALVLDVAPRAIAGHRTVNATVCRHARFDRLMAAEAAGDRHSLHRIVAAPAPGHAFERGVRL